MQVHQTLSVLTQLLTTLQTELLMSLLMEESIAQSNKLLVEVGATV